MNRILCVFTLSSLVGFQPERMVAAESSTSATRSVRSSGSRPVTFNQDIAPLIFAHCVICHRPGQAAPFPLLSYHDVQKRAKQIVEVTQRRFMPPWLPEPGYGEFENERRLSQDELALLSQWFEQGSAEGSPSELPAAPGFAGAWTLGKPDLIVEMPKSYPLQSNGKDVYRNFVIPLALGTDRYVRAVEFRPGNPKIVHHAFIKLDPSRKCRKLDGADGQPGFAGMGLPEGVQMPEGHFLAWQPGKIPS